MPVSDAIQVPFEPGPSVMPQRLEVWRLSWQGAGAARKLLPAAPIPAYEYARGVLTYCDVGAWQVRFPVLDVSTDVPRKGDRMHFMLRGKSIESGPITKCKLTYSATADTLWCDTEGVGEESALLRIIYPDAARAAENQTTQSHDARSGIASTVLLGYVRAQAGINAQYGELQRYTNAVDIAPDPLVGKSVTLRERYSSLLAALQRAALVGEVGFRVSRALGGVPVFEVFQPRDRSAGAVFDVQRGNVETMSWEWSAPTATAVIAGGTGDLTGRSIVADSDLTTEAEWQRRIEVFRDQRSESDASQLRADNLAALLDAAAQESITVKPTDSPLARYGEAYRLGDIVRARMVTGDGTVLREVVDRVQQVSWRATSAGFVASPVIGTDGSADLSGRRIREISKRLAQVEGAQ